MTTAEILTIGTEILLGEIVLSGSAEDLRTDKMVQKSYLDITKNVRLELFEHSARN